MEIISFEFYHKKIRFLQIPTKNWLIERKKKNIKTKTKQDNECPNSSNKKKTESFFDYNVTNQFYQNATAHTSNEEVTCWKWKMDKSFFLQI